MLGHILCSVRDTPSRGLQPDPLRWSTTKKAHRASWTDCAAGLTPRISVCFRPFAAHMCLSDPHQQASIPTPKKPQSLAKKEADVIGTPTKCRCNRVDSGCAASLPFYCRESHSCKSVPGRC